SLGHNISNDGSGNLTAAGDLPNTNPLLGPLANNGGPTQTRALLPGSPAINAGDPAAAPATDQRGLPGFGTTAMGAFEYQFKVPNTSDSGNGSLRQAILNANATPNLPGSPDVIRFAIPGSGVQTIKPLSALPSITDPVIIDGYSQPGS